MEVGGNVAAGFHSRLDAGNERRCNCQPEGGKGECELADPTHARVIAPALRGSKSAAGAPGLRYIVWEARDWSNRDFGKAGIDIAGLPREGCYVID